MLQYGCTVVVHSRRYGAAQTGAQQPSQQRAMTVILTSLVCPQVPPLRVRPADVADMAVYFSRQLSKRSAVRQLGLTSGAVRQLESYDFPNNIQVLPIDWLALLVWVSGTLWIAKRENRRPQSLYIPCGTDLRILQAMRRA